MPIIFLQAEGEDPYDEIMKYSFEKNIKTKFISLGGSSINYLSKYIEENLKNSFWIIL